MVRTIDVERLAAVALYAPLSKIKPVALAAKKRVLELGESADMLARPFEFFETEPETVDVRGSHLIPWIEAVEPPTTGDSVQVAKAKARNVELLASFVATVAPRLPSIFR